MKEQIIKELENMLSPFRISKDELGLDSYQIRHAALEKLADFVVVKIDMAEISGMQQAKSRVLRRTEIPKDARNPTRDATVIIGEDIARIIDEDIAQFTARQEDK